ncbi:MAG: hypothetical protein RL015_3049 [Verrucomicrobiota bacterium]
MIPRLEQWSGGAVERWSGGAVEQWGGGAVGRWSSGAVEQCIFNAPALQDSKGSISPKVITFSMAILGYPSVMAIWHHEFAFAFTGRSARLTSAPPIENDLIQLLSHRFHIGISEVGVDGDDVVRIRAGLVQRVQQAIVELQLGHFTGWALDSGWPLRSVVVV